MQKYSERCRFNFQKKQVYERRKVYNDSISSLTKHWRLNIVMPWWQKWLIVIGDEIKGVDVIFLRQILKQAKLYIRPLQRNILSKGVTQYQVRNEVVVKYLVFRIKPSNQKGATPLQSKHFVQVSNEMHKSADPDSWRQCVIGSIFSSIPLPQCKHQELSAYINVNHIVVYNNNHHINVISRIIVKFNETARQTRNCCFLLFFGFHISLLILPVLSILVVHVDVELRPSFGHFSQPTPASSSNFFICRCCYKQSLLMIGSAMWKMNFKKTIYLVLCIDTPILDIIQRQHKNAAPTSLSVEKRILMCAQYTRG